jgi:hypothetical protein
MAGTAGGSHEEVKTPRFSEKQIGDFSCVPTPATCQLASK